MKILNRWTEWQEQDKKAYKWLIIISQLSVIIGVIIGGLIAYFIF